MKDENERYQRKQRIIESTMRYWDEPLCVDLQDYLAELVMRVEDLEAMCRERVHLADDALVCSECNFQVPPQFGASPADDITCGKCGCRAIAVTLAR